MTLSAEVKTNSATPAAAENLCEAREISHDFMLPNGKPLRVIDNISVAIKPNEVVALLGPSGCGKSTLLRILLGLITPSKGNVFYHGKPMIGRNPGGAIVFQSFALYPWMSVFENIEIVLKAAGHGQDEINSRAKKVIQTVGLTGFEEAYPRELSGGMKQRVGMARALSVNPEILFMDEPFSHVDALTAESLRAEVIDLWAAQDSNPSSILMVSHDIKEVVYMADRIIVLGANPGRVRTVVENKLARPRDYRSPELLRLVDHLHEIITGHEMPDAPAAAPVPVPGIAELEPIPSVTSSEIIGLIEYLDARGGKEDIFKIASDTHYEFGRTMTVVKAAELLEFVDTPKRTVVLDKDGIRFVKADAHERKTIWRQQLLKLRLFKEILELIKRQPNREADPDLIKETIVFRMPFENYEKVFDTLIGWSRYGDLLAYDEDTQSVWLQTED